MATIRAFKHADVPAVAALRARSFTFSEHTDRAAVEMCFEEILLESPWYSDASPSLVYEDAGEIVGFLGLMFREIRFRNERLRGAIATEFMVDPARRGLPGLALLRQLFRGDQDLTFSDVTNDDARMLWERMGGHTAHLHSMQWTRALRPFRMAAAGTGSTPAARLTRLATRPLLNALDAAAARTRGSTYRQSAPAGRRGYVEVRDIIAHMNGILPNALRLEYDEPSLSWLIERLGQKNIYGRLKQFGVWDAEDTLVGWCFYFEQPGGVSQVAQFAARHDRQTLVFDHLLHDAWRSGALAITGRLESAATQHLSDRSCVLSRSAPWTTVHSRRPDVLNAICSGDAYFSRLDGEWWMNF